LDQDKSNESSEEECPLDNILKVIVEKEKDENKDSHTFNSSVNSSTSQTGKDSKTKES